MIFRLERDGTSDSTFGALLLKIERKDKLSFLVRTDDFGIVSYTLGLIFCDVMGT